MYSSTLFLTSVLERGESLASRPGRSLPPGKNRYSLYRRLSGPQGRSGQVRKISLPPGFDPRTVQPIGSRYTNWATRPTRAPLIVQKTSKITLQYLIQQTARVTINKHVLLCNAPPTCWDFYRPSSGRYFKAEYNYRECCPRCAYM